MKKLRDDFQAGTKAHAQAGEATLQAGKAQLESQWRGFESQIRSYFDAAGRQVEQEQATFRDVVAAQAKAWGDATEKFHTEAANIAAARRYDLEAAVKQMQADGAEAEARLQKLKQAGSESWVALSAALAESRKAFDRANQQVADAFKAATPEGTRSIG